MANHAHRQELAAFLRARRNRISPEEVGITPGGRRRTPGLRREEVAQLAGVSVTWYTWLEQGRDITASKQVLAGLGKALRLDDAERQHLFALAGESLAIVRPAQPPSPQLRRMIDALSPNPALLLGPTWDLLAWNDAVTAMIGDPAARRKRDRNVIRMAFTETAFRRLVVDWRSHAASLLANWRADTGKYLGDPRFARFTAELRESSAEFRELWDEHAVGTTGTSTSEVMHPKMGRLAMDCALMVASESTDVRLMTCLPADEATAEKFADLVSLPVPASRTPLAGNSVSP